MNNTKYYLYVRFTFNGSEVKVGEYTDKDKANEMLDKAVNIWGYGKLIHTTKKGIEVIKVKRKTCRCR